MSRAADHRRASAATAGMRTRREVLGDAHVDRAVAAHDPVHRRLPGLHHPHRLGRPLAAARAWPAATAAC